MVGSIAVDLDHLVGIEIALRGNMFEVRRDFRVVAHRDVANATRCWRFFQMFEDICDLPLEPNRGDGERLVIDAQRPNRRYSFDHAVDLQRVEPSGERQHFRADVQIDLVAKIDNQCGIARGEHIVIDHNAGPPRGPPAGKGALDCSLSRGCLPVKSGGRNHGLSEMPWHNENM